jgi:hypothetical protein
MEYNMTELSKETKLVCMINIIIAFIYTFLFLVIPEAYKQMSDAPDLIYSPITWRQLGASILVLGIGGVLTIKRDDWDKAKLFWEISIIWLIIMLIINIWGMIAHLNYSGLCLSIINIPPEPTFSGGFSLINTV